MSDNRPPMYNPGPGYPGGPAYQGAPGYGPGAGYGTGPAPMAPDGSDRGVAIFAHLSALIAAIVSAGSVAFLGPLLVWVIYKDKSPFVRQAAAGSFNFNLSMLILYVVGAFLTFTFILSPIGIPMMVVAAFFSVLLSIIGALRASKGRPYRYPMQLRVLS